MSRRPHHCSHCYARGHHVTTCPELIPGNLAGIDRRERYQLRRIEAGCCRTCGKPRAPGDRRYCASHRAKENAKQRARRELAHG